MSDLATAARKWLDLYAECKRLRVERMGFQCDKEGSGSPGHRLGAKPCWKQHRQCAPDDWEHLPHDEWCEPCRVRENIHFEYREKVASRGAALRNLIRLRKIERTRPDLRAQA